MEEKKLAKKAQNEEKAKTTAKKATTTKVDVVDIKHEKTVRKTFLFKNT